MTPLALRIVAATFVCALTACQGGNEATVQGWVEANLIFVGPDEAGRIQTLSVREGDAVATTAPLFTVRPLLRLSRKRARGSPGSKARSSARRRSRSCRRRRSAPRRRSLCPKSNWNGRRH
jgi:multidrug efflux pump subunit AcrA (membrane-fusion protein)